MRFRYFIGGLLFISGSAIAALGGVPPLSMELTVDGETFTWLPVGKQVGEDLFAYTGDLSETGWDLSWNIIADADPFVNSALGLTNTDVVTQSFVIDVILPIAPPVQPDSLIGGSIGGALTDSNFDGSATLATEGGAPLYAGLVDLATALTLYADPYSVSTTFAGETVQIPAISAGLPGPTLPGPQALDSIGIRYEFTLTPGDSVGLTSFFVVVPEPAALLLLGLLGTLVRRR